MEHFYGARTEPIYQKLKKLNDTGLSNASRLTLYNDAHIRTNDSGEYTGKKNFRFILGSTGGVWWNDRIQIYTNFEQNIEHKEALLDALGDDLDWGVFHDHGSRGSSYMIFDTHDRSVYLFSHSAHPYAFQDHKIFLNSNCDFSSVRFENSLELPKNVVYKLDYFNRQLIEVIDLGV